MELFFFKQKKKMKRKNTYVYILIFILIERYQDNIFLLILIINDLMLSK